MKNPTRPAKLADLKIAVSTGLIRIDPIEGVIHTSRIRGGKRIGNGWRRAERTLKSGYLRIYFTQRRELLHTAAHRAIWCIAHDRDIPEGLQIDHLDFVKTNNQIENLEAVTPATNMARLVAAGRSRGGRPRTIPDRARFSIRMADGTYREIAGRFGVSVSTVWKIRNG